MWHDSILVPSSGVSSQPRAIHKPILPVRDLGEAADFYRRLGFTVTRHDDGYAWVLHAGDELLHLRLVPDVRPETNAASCYLHVQDADAWHAQWARAGVTMDPVADQPWGMREFAVIDPSGNLVRVGRNR